MPSAGPPSELARDVTPGLNSANNIKSKNTEVPEDAYVRTANPEREILMEIKICPWERRGNYVTLNALLDSGANAIFIDRQWADENHIPLFNLRNPIPVFNVDGTRNSAGSISHAAELVLEFQGHRERITAEVTDLGKNAFILGFSWLKRHNPEIDWTRGTVRMTRCPRQCHRLRDKTPFVRRIEEKEEELQYHVH